MKLVVRILLVLALVVVGSPTFVQAAPSCTKVGTQGPDQMNGTDQRDVLCARAGEDYGNGRAAADIVRGGRGPDTVVGGSGPDALLGKLGNDQLFATDGAPGDRVNGGRGNDKCYGDQGDHFSKCEHKVRL